MDGANVFTDEKYDPQITHNFPYLVTCRDPVVHPAMFNWGLMGTLHSKYVHRF